DPRRLLPMVAEVTEPVRRSRRAGIRSGHDRTTRSRRGRRSSRLMGQVTRRQALARAGVAAVGIEVALATLGGPAKAGPAGVPGAWHIEPTTSGGSAGFRAVAAFAAGGVFITIGSDEPGTGIGEWNSPTSDTFAFTYVNFHFDSNAKLNNTVKVRAAGSF